MRVVRRSVLIPGAVYVLGVAGLWAFQRELIYAPDSVGYVPPSEYALLDGVAEITLRTSDGLELNSWYARAPAGRPTVVMFPGKSSSLSSQRYRVARLVEADLGVLLLAYRGYSGNDGEPSEQGLYQDATAALDWLQAAGVPASSIVLYGISLGSGVATEMASERAHGALILEAPYTSLVDVAALRYPLVPVRWLLRDRFDSLARAASLNRPLLIMHGERDAVIPQRLGRRLLEAAAAPKEGFWPEAAGHNDVFDRGGFEAATAFIDRWLGTGGYSLSAAAPSAG